jgi:membrane protein DedA with SNARE-associated domain
VQAIHDIFSSLLFSLGPFAREAFIFFLGFIEGLPIIGSLVPGGTMAILIGSLSQEGYINTFLAINLIAIGSFIGDMLGFIFGKYLRQIPYVKRMLLQEKHQKNWDLFDRHVALVIIFGKLLPVVRSTPSLFAGMSKKLNIWKYALYTAIASYLWAVVGIYAGNFLAETLGDYAIPLILGVAFALAIGIFISNRIKNRRKKKRIEVQNTETIEEAE